MNQEADLREDPGQRVAVSESQTSLAHAAVRGTTWTYIAFYSGKLIVFISTVILARLLTKDDFGVVGYAVTVISFLDVMKELGIGSALIYHKDNNVASTAFWLNIGVSTSLCALVWVGAPWVGVFFRDPRAVWVTRILALNFPISSIGSTHETLLIKQLAFNRKFIPDFAQAMSKGIVSVVLAALGFGPWSLIIGQLSGTLVSDVVDWILVPWRPAFTIVREAARSLLRFGLPMVGVNIVAMIVLNVDYLLVGRYLGPARLGVYTVAFRIPELVVLEFCAIVASVVFPVFTKIRDDADALRRGFQQTARYVALVTVPIGLGVALLSKPFLLVVFGQKWLEAAPVMTAISIYALLLSLGFNAGDVYKAQGRPGVLTQISLLKAAMLIPALYWAVTGPASLIAVGWVQVAIAFVGSVVYLAVAMRMLHLPLAGMLESFRPALTAGAALVVAVGAVLFFGRGAPDLVVLLGGALLGGLAYVGCLWLLDRALVAELWDLGRSVLVRK